ncbi:gp196 [Sphingomonas phage PAU]|uniref:gp196 n=1 Tax=Sphingomonas phage PAU TaxID=1150991 RepID=UPI0002573362|nr:gp196 [Sphingomonas phage PAU]AFF28194.1 gp196 [Sphingomonas phage PAU]
MKNLHWLLAYKLDLRCAESIQELEDNVKDILSILDKVKNDIKPLEDKLSEDVFWDLQEQLESCIESFEIIKVMRDMEFEDAAGNYNEALACLYDFCDEKLFIDDQVRRFIWLELSHTI